MDHVICLVLKFTIFFYLSITFQVSAIEIEAETSDPKAVEVKTTDEVEEVKSEETKEAAISERNQRTFQILKNRFNIKICSKK